MRPATEPQQHLDSASPAGHDKKSGKSGVSRFVLYGAVVGNAMCFYGALYRFPLVNGVDSPFFYPLVGAGFVATIAITVWWASGPKGFKLKGQPASWASWVGYGSLYGLFITLFVAFGGLGALATCFAFVTLNGALDFNPATQRTYTVAEFHKRHCSGEGAKDQSYYLLEPRGVQGGNGPIQARVRCSDDGGLPVDNNGTVPVGGEVVVEIKPGAFGEPWQAGYRAP